MRPNVLMRSVSISIPSIRLFPLDQVVREIIPDGSRTECGSIDPIARRGLGMMTPHSTPLRLGFIGYGTAARHVMRGLEEGKAGDAVLRSVLVRRPLAGQPDGVMATTDRERFLAEPLDLVVELAGQ